MNERLIRRINREQMCWRAVDVERLIGEEHPARAIWELVGKLDLGRFYERIESNAEEGGRPANDPRLLISLWVYAYSQGIGSAREVGRRCEWEPAFQWLTGCEEVNYHTLADFRVEQREELDELFTQVLGLLSAEGWIKLEQVMQDGTKIKAQASGRSFRREDRIREHLERARRQVAEMGDPQAEGESNRVRAARKRARRERQERLERALQELEKLRTEKQGKRAKDRAQVSVSDAEARRMRQADGGFAPSYNVQISADGAQGLIVGVQVVQERNDSQQLLPAVERITARLGNKPRQMMADGDYTNCNNVEAMVGAEVDYLGSLRPSGAERDMTGSGRFPNGLFTYDAEDDQYICPQGKRLRYQEQEKRKGVSYRRYEARFADCRDCPLKPQCCPQNRSRGRGILRAEPSPVVEAFRQKMATAEAQTQYRRRARTVEFCHAWIKSKLGIRQFHVRGLIKVQMEMLWACLTYNLQHWIRLRKLRTVLAPA